MCPTQAIVTFGNVSTYVICRGGAGWGVQGSGPPSPDQGHKEVLPDTSEAVASWSAKEINGFFSAHVRHISYVSEVQI